MFQKIKSRMRGSVLIFTLLLLSIALMAALSLATAVVVGTKSARDTNKSVQAFQTADSGVEIMLQKIKNANSDDSLAAIGCDNGNKASGIIRSGNSTYEITFYDSEEPANALDCSKKISDIAKIKSVGKFGGSVRAVETAVAAGGSGITGGCAVYEVTSGGSTNKQIQSIWGVGCRTSGYTSGLAARCGDANANGYKCGVTGYENDGDGKQIYSLCVCVEA